MCEGENIKNEIESLKGQYRLSADKVIENVMSLLKLELNLFYYLGYQAKKTVMAKLLARALALSHPLLKKLRRNIKMKF